MNCPKCGSDDLGALGPEYPETWRGCCECDERFETENEHAGHGHTGSRDNATAADLDRMRIGGFDGLS